MVADDTVWKNHARVIKEVTDMFVGVNGLGGNLYGDMPIENWFGFAWNRNIKYPILPKSGLHLNLGAGHREVDWAVSVDREHGVNLEQGLTSYSHETVNAIWAHGVFEHIENIPRLLQECQRVLVPGGLLNIVVPHGLSDLQAEDIDHKHPIVEDTWRNIMDNPYYSAGEVSPWTIKIHTQFIIGVVWRNLALFTQFVKEGK